MFLKNWLVIAVLAVAGLVLGWYWLANRPAPGVTPQGPQDWITTIAALAGAITTLAGAISGAAMKWLDFRKARLEIESHALDIEKKRRELAEK